MISCHYNDVIMSMMASQITSLTIVYSTVYSGADKKKTSKLRVTGLCEGNSAVSGEFPTQRASNAEKVSIWWRHRVSTESRTAWISNYGHTKLQDVVINSCYIFNDSLLTHRRLGDVTHVIYIYIYIDIYTLTEVWGLVRRPHSTKNVSFICHKQFFFGSS